MDIIKPPTDNLYKFLALSGLLILIISTTYPVWLYLELDKQSAGFHRDLKVLNIEAEKFQESRPVVDKAIRESSKVNSQALDAVEKFKKSQISLEEVRKALDEASNASGEATEKIKELEEEVHNWLRQHAEIEYKKDLLEISESAAKRVGGLAVIGTLAGLGITVWGFILWYQRVQKYEDIILKEKVSGLDNKKGDSEAITET
jgi:DNA-binding transcriptional MerR regulator